MNNHGTGYHMPKISFYLLLRFPYEAHYHVKVTCVFELTE